jgi:predicted metal-dependent hydrolase
MEMGRAAERSAIRFGTRTIAFVIRRSGRRKTVSIGVDARDGVTVAAPAEVELAAIERLVAGRARWIVETQRRYEDVEPGPAPREFKTGETFRYLGKQYRLRVAVSENGGRRKGSGLPVKLLGGWLTVEMRAGVAVEDRRTGARRALVAWYRRRAAEILAERVALWSGRLRLAAPPLLVREPRARWGSCDPRGNVRLNWRIVQAPSALVDYVVAHELVHLMHRNHGQAFWAALGRVMPAYEERRRALRRAGPQYFW